MSTNNVISLNNGSLMTKYPYKYFVLALVWFLVYTPVKADSLREYHQRMCNDGKQESCQKAEAMLQGEYLAERIEKLGDQFASTVDRLKREENNKPILRNAYIDILNDYFKSSVKKGQEQTSHNETLTLCAEHFHDYWLNRKMWWPTDEDGKPDWATIYYYIVDHYYGYCLAIINL